jgi:hypothetical protein
MGRVNRRVRLALGAGVFAVVGASVGVAGSALAASGRSPTRAVQNAPATPAVFAKETLKATYIEHGDSKTAESAGFFAVDPSDSITCGAKAGKTCSIEVTASVQGGSITTAGNTVALPWQLDGNYVGLFGPYIGETEVDGGYSEFTYSDFEQGVAPGTHTVQTFGYSVDGFTLGNWSITYQVYWP